MDPVIVLNVCGAIVAAAGLFIVIFSVTSLIKVMRHKEKETEKPAFSTPTFAPKHRSEEDTFKYLLQHLMTRAMEKCKDHEYELCDWDEEQKRYKTPDEGGALQCKLCLGLYCEN